MRVTIEGDKEFEAAIRKIAKQSPDQLDKMLSKMAFDTNAESIKSMQRTPRTGRVYFRGKGGDIRHTASSAGNAPAIDTGNLVKNVQVKREKKNDYTTGSRKGAGYGLFLEFGTRTIQARPWLVPAYNKTIGNFRKYLKKYVEK